MLKFMQIKPTFSDTFSENSGTVVGVREEEYSIVPQQVGTITLPEIKITWYNLQTKRTETSTLPEKTITVAPGVISSTPNVISLIIQIKTNRRKLLRLIIQCNQNQP